MTVCAFCAACVACWYIRADLSESPVRDNNAARSSRFNCGVRRAQLLSVDGNPWLFHSGDAITSTVKAKGTFEPAIGNLIRRQLSIADGMMVDIGANVGVMTSVALSLGREVVAVEALPDNANLLRCSADHNGWATLLKLHNTPLADPASKSERFCVCRPIGNPSDGILVPFTQFADHPFCGGDQRKTKGAMEHCAEEMKSITLDEILGSGSNPIAFMKMDIEGNECRVLKGAAATLRGGNPCTILTEYNPGLQQYTNCTLIDMIDHMKLLGYLPHTFQRQGCSLKELTSVQAGKMSAPGSVHNICWKPLLVPKHCVKKAS